MASNVERLTRLKQSLLALVAEINALADEGVRVEFNLAADAAGHQHVARFEAFQRLRIEQ